MYVMTDMVVPLLSGQNNVFCQLSLSSWQIRFLFNTLHYTWNIGSDIKISLNGPTVLVSIIFISSYQTGFGFGFELGSEYFALFSKPHLKTSLNGPCVLVSIKHLHSLLHKHRRADRHGICQVFVKYFSNECIYFKLQ